MLALTFKDAKMYDKIDVKDRLDVVRADEIAPGKNLVLKVRIGWWVLEG